MSDIAGRPRPDRASVVIIGAGIVGNSLAYHLSELGVTDIVQVDKGPLPNPGGSTGHASNFLFPFEHSRMMREFTMESVAQYKALGVFTESGGIEVARSEERLQEFRRKLASCKAWGVEAELLTPAQVKDLVPYLDDSLILGGMHFPTTGVVDSLGAGTIMRNRALESGALTVLGNTEVTGLRVTEGRVTAVETSEGDLECDRAVICCGVWSPRIARMAGVRIPLIPTVHQMISVGPIKLFAEQEGEINYPIIRDMDTYMYERQHGADMEVGSYAHRPILIEPDDIPSIEASVLSPTELPFTEEDFEPQMEQALELMPELLGDESAGVRYAINGLISLTPDGHPVLGPIPGVEGLWSAAASWIKEAPGIAKTVAEWMVTGDSEIDAHEGNIARFQPHEASRAHVRHRAEEAFNKTYGIVHPSEQWAQGRNVRRAPMWESERELGAVFFETAGWERPHWYASNESLVKEFGDRINHRRAEWDARWWSPIIEAEHLAMRERVGLVDLTAFAVFDVKGADAAEALNSIAAAQVDVAVGRVVYTPMLDEKGKLRADLTIMRLAKDHFRVVTGGGVASLDYQWIADHLPAGKAVTITDVSSAWSTIGLWGPRAYDVLSSVTLDDVSPEGLKFGTCKEIELDGVRVLVSRISYVGEFGWELYVPFEQGAQVWERLLEAGKAHGIAPVGIGVYGTTARLEKSYRSYGHELSPEYSLVETGLERKVVKKQDFIGKEAHLAERDKTPDAVLCTLAVDYEGVSPAERRYPLGHESIVTAEGKAIVDAQERPSYVMSAGPGPSVGKYLLLAFLTPEYAVEGTRLAVECMGTSYPVEVLVAGSGGVWDPDNDRLKG